MNAGFARSQETGVQRICRAYQWSKNGRTGGLNAVSGRTV